MGILAKKRRDYGEKKLILSACAQMECCVDKNQRYVRACNFLPPPRVFLCLIESTSSHRHCEERSDVAIQSHKFRPLRGTLDCHASLAMTPKWVNLKRTDSSYRRPACN
jgi:hypothetical protein